jgi:hypothetical protein
MRVQIICPYCKLHILREITDTDNHLYTCDSPDEGGCERDFVAKIVLVRTKSYTLVPSNGDTQ